MQDERKRCCLRMTSGYGRGNTFLMINRFCFYESSLSDPQYGFLRWYAIPCGSWGIPGEDHFSDQSHTLYLCYEEVLRDENETIHNLYGKCIRDNLHSIWAGQELYVPGNTREMFCSILEKNMRPVYDSARRQGYEEWKIRE